MHTSSRRSLSVGLCSAGILAALLLVPTASPAQGNTITGTEALSHNTSGSANTADGYYALFYNTTGNYNTANGYQALFFNTTGSFNIANGFDALFSNTTGNYNIATGFEALWSNTTGYDNTVNGYQALFSNTTGYYNTVNGYQALFYNTTGYWNTANGMYTLRANTTGDYNTANGFQALFSNTTGSYITANGVGALYFNTTGSNNTAEGYYALFNSSTGSDNIALGNGAGLNITTGSNNIDIGSQGAEADTGVIRVGTVGTHKQTYIAGISGVTSSNGVEVYINSNGQLGTIKSSQRFKYDIQDMGAKSDKLMDLRPVLFRYKEASEDGTHPVQYGLIAEEVAKVYPDLVQYDKQGKPFTVYYHLLTPMMLNDLQRAHRQLDAQQSQMAFLQNQVQNQSSQMSSLQHTNQLQFMVFAAFVLVFAAYIVATRARRSPSRPSVHGPSEQGVRIFAAHRR